MLFLKFYPDLTCVFHKKEPVPNEYLMVYTFGKEKEMFMSKVPGIR